MPLVEVAHQHAGPEPGGGADEVGEQPELPAPFGEAQTQVAVEQVERDPVHREVDAEAAAGLAGGLAQVAAVGAEHAQAREHRVAEGAVAERPGLPHHELHAKGAGEVRGLVLGRRARPAHDLLEADDIGRDLPDDRDDPIEVAAPVEANTPVDVVARHDERRHPASGARGTHGPRRRNGSRPTAAAGASAARERPSIGTVGRRRRTRRSRPRCRRRKKSSAHITSDPIIPLMADSLLDYFPAGYTPRPEQRRLLDDLERLLEAPEGVVLVEAPPGLGKSHIAMTLARWSGDAYLLTSQKLLQDQYERLFGAELHLVKGRDNYPCELYPPEMRVTALHGRCRRPRGPRCQCPYARAKAAALERRS